MNVHFGSAQFAAMGAYNDEVLSYTLKKLMNFLLLIYNTKIDEFDCPPNTSETVAVRIMKLAHRPRIAVHFINFNKCNSANRRRVPQNIVQINMCERGRVLPSCRSICIILCYLVNQYT